MKKILLLVGSFVIAWLVCHLEYKALFPYSSTGPGASLWIVIIPLGLFLWVCFGYLFLGFGEEEDKPTSYHRTGSYNGSSSSSSYNSPISSNSTSQSNHQPFQGNSTFSDEIFQGIETKRKIESLERDNDYYRMLNSSGGSVYDSNIENNNLEIDRLKRSL